MFQWFSGQKKTTRLNQKKKNHNQKKKTTTLWWNIIQKLTWRGPREGSKKPKSSGKSAEKLPHNEMRRRHAKTTNKTGEWFQLSTHLKHISSNWKSSPKLGVKMFKEYWNHHPESAWIKLDESNHRIQKLQSRSTFSLRFLGRFGTQLHEASQVGWMLHKMTWLQHTLIYRTYHPLGFAMANPLSLGGHTTGLFSCHLNARNPHIFWGWESWVVLKKTYPVDHRTTPMDERLLKFHNWI